VCGPAADRALAADRPAPDADPHPPRVAIVGQRVQLPPRGAAEHRHQRRLGQRGDLADRHQPARVQLDRGLVAHAPQSLDRQRVQELELAGRRHDEQPVRLRHPRGDLGEELRRATPTVTAIPTSSRTRERNRTAISSGDPAIRRMPRTSMNASSIESPSTTGDVSSNTSNMARDASCRP
jgi:hypothetical protein